MPVAAEGENLLDNVLGLYYASASSSKDGMALIYETMHRLDVRGPANRGIVVDAEGAMLGPDCTLVRRAAAGIAA